MVYWLLLLVFTVPWENIIQFKGIGRVSRAAGLLVAIVWILSVIRSGRIRLPTAFHVALLAFVLWNGLSAFWTVDLAATTERFFTYVQIFVFVYIMWDVVDTRQDAALSVPQAYVLGAWVTAASVIVTFASNGLAGYEDRVGTGTFQYTDMGLILVFGIPFAWYLASTAVRTSRLMKLVNMVYIPLGAYAVMLTGSRAAIVSMAAAVLYILVTLLRGRLAFKVLGLVVIGALAYATTLVPQATVERLSTTSGGSAAGLDGRTEIWHQAFESFAARPFTGTGAAAFRTSDSQKVAHNFALGFLAEVGLIGFVLFMIILVKSFRTALRLPDGLRALWITMLMTWLIGASLYNFEEKKQTWLIFGLIAVCGRLFAPVSEHPPHEGEAEPRPTSGGRVPVTSGPVASEPR